MTLASVDWNAQWQQRTLLFSVSSWVFIIIILTCQWCTVQEEEALRNDNSKKVTKVTL